MSTLEDWLSDVERELGLPAGQIPAELRDQLLALTRDVAHDVARIAGPLTCYLLGVAAGRGGAADQAATAVTALVRTRPHPADTGDPASPS